MGCSVIDSMILVKRKEEKGKSKEERGKGEEKGKQKGGKTKKEEKQQQHCFPTPQCGALQQALLRKTSSLQCFFHTKGEMIARSSCA